MENKNFFHSFDKIETKADVLKYALEFTQIDGKPNYDEARKMFEFFTSLVNVPDERENYMKPLLEVIDKMNTKTKE
jgi:hypothetical protein